MGRRVPALLARDPDEYRGIRDVDDLPGGAGLAAVEADAAAMGAVLAIVPAAPGAAREQQLTRRGWTVASQWYLGTPAPPTPAS